MDSKKTLEKLKGESDRLRVSLYLSQSILAEFKEACQGISPSKVMEELMKEFVQDAKSKNKKIKKN
jgi:hypothetical protein